jgi:hypothetical protein
MFDALAGSAVAAPCSVYRHALARALISVLGPLRGGPGWSPVAVALGAILMSLDAAPTLTQRFESARGVLDAALPRRRKVGRTFQGFVKALSRHADALLGLIGPRLRERTRLAAGKAWTLRGFVAIGADSSKIDAPRTIANEALGFAGKDKCGPQMVLLVLLHLGVMLPWAYKVGAARDAERTLLRSMLGVLPQNTLLVMDAGFTGFDLLSDLMAHKVRFLVRVGANVHLLTQLGSYRREGKHTVYLWPDSKRDRPPLRLRLIRVGSAWLVTDVTDPRELPRSLASELYRRRWGIEVAFRSLKQILERRKVRSCTAAHARAELAWSVVGMWTLMLAGAWALAKGCGPPRLSVAGTLAAVRHAMHTPMSDRALKQRLRRCLIEKRERTSSKKAYRWAHKKNSKPPGKPRITKATPAQVKAAKALRQRKTTE